MARPLRIEFPGALYHVTTRGDGREAIFLDDLDRRHFLSVFSDVIHRFNWRCHAYCLMGNHYHLVVETPEANLARGMRQLNGVYTQHLNRRHGRVGHVFQGRYKAILVERDAYLKELARYVVLNPVRAGIASSADKWPWSSYRATAGIGEPVPWLEVAWLLSQFGDNRGAARAAYRRFVSEGKRGPVIWADLKGQIFLGGERFVAKMHRRLDPARDLAEVPRAQKRQRMPLEHFGTLPVGRNEAMARAHVEGGHSLAKIGRHFGVHYSTVSRAVKMWQCKT